MPSVHISIEDTAVRIVILDARWRWQISLTPRPLRYPLAWRQVCPQSRAGRKLIFLLCPVH